MQALLILIALFLAAVALHLAADARREARGLRLEVESFRDYLVRLHRELELLVARRPGDANAIAPVAEVEVAADTAAPDHAAGAAPAAVPIAAGEARAAAAEVETVAVPQGLPAAATIAGAQPFAESEARAEAAPARYDQELERRLGARLPIWLGAIALALAGIFLVQYTIERGWLTPGRRVGLALAFGALLVGASGRTRGSSARIGQALAGAGIAVLYAALLAGVRLYGLIPAPLGFGLMAGNTALAVALALRHGPLPAILGLAGGFLTPALIGLDSAGRSGSLVYLLLLDVGLLAAARSRRWPLLAAGALAGTFIWTLALLLPSSPTPGTAGLSVYLLVALALFAAVTLRADAGREWGDAKAPDFLALAAGLGTIVLQLLIVARSEFDTLEWSFLGLLVLGSLVLARRDERRFFSMAVAAPAAAGAALFAWGTDLPPAQLGRFVATTAALAVLIAGISCFALFRSVRPRRWSALAGLAAVGALALAALFARGVGDARLAAAAVAVAGVLAAVTTRVLTERSGAEEIEPAELAAATAWLAAASSGAVAIALLLVLEREWLSIGFAVGAAALVFLRGRIAIPALPWLGGAAFAVAVVRLVLNPGVLLYPIGRNPVLTWLLWGYGLPCLLGFWAATELRRLRARELADAFEGGAIAVAAAGVTLQAWQIAAPGTPELALVHGGLWAWSLQTVAWLALAGALLVAARTEARPARARGGRALAALGAATALAIHGVAFNPAWSSQPVGSAPILNWLLFYFGVPLAVLLWIARELQRTEDRIAAGVARAIAMVLGFLLVTLEVRQIFRGTDLTAGDGSGAENFSYSAVWAVLGTLLLLVGIVRGARALRLAALAVMLMATLKVFLYDASGLSGLYRVLSFLGLGVTLLLLAWLYQRYVYHEEPGA